MAVLEITCFGPFGVCRDGDPLAAVSVARGQALLAFLAVENDRPHQRVSLATLLWPDQSEVLALRNLSQTLVRLRTALGEHDTPIAANRQALWWDGTAVVDVQRFRGLLQTGGTTALTTAAALYQGPLLAGFSLPEADTFEEWLALTREALHQQALTTLRALADRSLAAGAFAAAAAAARRHLALDPWREEVYRQLMRALAGDGDYAGALEVYARCRQVLHDDLGLAPDAATADLAAQVTQALGIQPAANVEPPAAVGAPLARHNLSAPLDALIGREAELARIGELLSGTDRLVTIVGAGGIGKTRLALSSAWAMHHQSADGVWWVALAGVEPSGDPTAQAEVLATLIAGACGRNLAGHQPLAELAAALRERPTLLVLDNCEHLAALGTVVRALLLAAPHLRVLATSRMPLNVDGETLVRLDGLPVPPVDALDPAAYAGVQLFVRCAAAQEPGWGAQQNEIEEAAQLCRLLDGMPLGIELAARWVGHFTPAEIAAALQDDLDFLAARNRDVPARQRSLRAAFSYSWRLLSEVERAALARLTVFRGGFDRAAALAVAEVRVPILAALVDASLLRQVGVGQYSLHELLRQFAAEQLAVTPDQQASVAARHSSYYLAFVASRERTLSRDRPRQASEEIRNELSNIRQAWAWAAAHGEYSAVERAAYGLWQFCLLNGPESEGRQTFGLAAEQLRGRLTQPGADVATQSALRATLSKVLAIHANYLFAQNHDALMAAEAREALVLAEASGEMEGKILASFVLGRALQELGQQHDARAIWQWSIQLCETHRADLPASELLPEIEWMAYSWLRGNLLFFGDYAGATSCTLQALRICQAQRKLRGEMFCLIDLAWNNLLLGDCAAARQGFEQALPITRELGYRWGELRTQRGLGWVLQLQGAYVPARTLLIEAASMAHELGVVYDEALILVDLIRLHRALGAAIDTWLDQLSRLMERLDLPRECQSQRLVVRALCALDRDDAATALVYAEQALELAQQADNRNSWADIYVVIGDIRLRLNLLVEAAAAYRWAFDHYGRVGNRALRLRPQAKLAEIAMLQGDLRQAAAQVEEILAGLEETGGQGVDAPAEVYLCCVRVLEANHDPRAATVVQAAQQLIQQYADAIGDAALRRSFRENVAANRILLAGSGRLGQPNDIALGQA